MPTDAHCHLPSGPGRHFVCSPFGSADACSALPPGSMVFYGAHPWHLDGFDPDGLRARLAADPSAGVGETGLDRLRDRTVSARMREVFEAQLAVAAEFRRCVVLHGAKCWGEVVRACRPYAGRIPAFLFHGFSRSDGLLPDIAAMNGFVSVGPAVLNDHAVNYRGLVRKIPGDMLLVETDRTRENAAKTPPVEAVAAKVAELRGVSADAAETLLEANAGRFIMSNMV